MRGLKLKELCNSVHIYFSDIDFLLDFLAQWYTNTTASVMLLWLHVYLQILLWLLWHVPDARLRKFLLVLCIKIVVVLPLD